MPILPRELLSGAGNAVAHRAFLQAHGAGRHARHRNGAGNPLLPEKFAAKRQRTQGQELNGSQQNKPNYVVHSSTSLIVLPRPSGNAITRLLLIAHLTPSLENATGIHECLFTRDAPAPLGAEEVSPGAFRGALAR